MDSVESPFFFLSLTRWFFHLLQKILESPKRMGNEAKTLVMLLVSKCSGAQQECWIALLTTSRDKYGIHEINTSLPLNPGNSLSTIANTAEVMLGHLGNQCFYRLAPFTFHLLQHPIQEQTIKLWSLSCPWKTPSRSLPWALKEFHVQFSCSVAVPLKRRNSKAAKATLLKFMKQVWRVHIQSCLDYF